MPFDQWPEFSISHSRIQTFMECPRRYAYATYESHGGWQEDAHPRRRQSYRLKQLQNLHGVLGTAVHEESRRFALAARAGEALPDAAEVVDRLECAVVEAVNARDFFAFASDPKRHPLLRSVYYDGHVAAREIAAVRAKIQPVAHNLVRSKLWPELTTMQDCDLRLEELASFDFEGVPLWLVVDLLATGNDPDDLLLIDFKSSAGEVHPEAQLAVYGLYARHLGGINPERWRVRMVNWVTGEVRPVHLSDAALAAAEHRLRAAVAEMRRYQSRPELNIPVPLPAFECASETHRNVCVYECEFLELCVSRFGLRP